MKSQKIRMRLFNPASVNGNAGNKNQLQNSIILHE